MSSSTFRELLSQPTDQVERPKVLADGHYLGECSRHEFGVSRQKQTPYARFFFKPTEETDDIVEGANVGIDFATREVYTTFYITPNALYRLSDFLDAVLGKQIGHSFDERIPETRGARVMFEVTHRDVLNDAGEVTNTFNDVGTVVAA